jgi:hypothetical protein
MDPVIQQQIQNNIQANVIMLAVLGAGALICSYVEMSCWMISGENQTKV